MEDVAGVEDDEKPTTITKNEATEATGATGAKEATEPKEATEATVNEQPHKRVRPKKKIIVNKYNVQYFTHSDFKKIYDYGQIIYNDDDDENNYTYYYEHDDSKNKKIDSNYIERHKNHNNIQDIIKNKTDMFKKGMYDKHINLTKYNDYDRYIVFSDIHGDLIVFFSTIIKSGIIVLVDDFGNTINKKEILKNISDDYENINIIINYLCKYSIKLNCSRTMVYILGDVIDGARPYGYDSEDGNEDGGQYYYHVLNNTYGLNEIIIHMIIFNMRISSLQTNSYVKIIGGNHDASEYNYFLDIDDGVLTYSLFDYVNHIDYKTKKFYKIQDNNQMATTLYQRNQMLLPFYKIDNCFFDVIYDQNKIIAILSHASFDINNDTKGINMDINQLKEYKKWFYDNSDEVNLGDAHYNAVSTVAYSKTQINANMGLHNISYYSLYNTITSGRTIMDAVQNNLTNNLNKIKLLQNVTYIMGHEKTYPHNKNKEEIQIYQTESKAKIIMVDNAWSCVNTIKNKGDNDGCKTFPDYTEMLIITKQKSKIIDFDYKVLRVTLKDTYGKNILYKMRTTPPYYIYNNHDGRYELNIDPDTAQQFGFMDKEENKTYKDQPNDII